MGMEAALQTTGIFPSSDSPQAEDDSEPPMLDTETLVHFDNYSSMADNSEEAITEFDRLLKEKFAVAVPKSFWLQLKRGHVHKMAVIVKTKRDGTKKVRIVIDMRRSGANARSAVPERPVLPRPMDAIADGLSCLSSPPVRLTPHAALDDLLDEVQEDTVEQVSADFGDAYMHLAVKEEELKHCIVREPTRYLRSTGRKLTSPTAKAMAKRQAQAGYKVLPMVSFGSKGAPLVWSRVAAAIGRMTAAMLRRRRSRVQIYLDDPLLHLVGIAFSAAACSRPCCWSGPRAASASPGVRASKGGSWTGSAFSSPLITLTNGSR